MILTFAQLLMLICRHTGFRAVWCEDRKCILVYASTGAAPIAEIHNYAEARELFGD